MHPTPQGINHRFRAQMKATYPEWALYEDRNFQMGQDDIVESRREA